MIGDRQKIDVGLPHGQMRTKMGIDLLEDPDDIKAANNKVPLLCLNFQDKTAKHFLLFLSQIIAVYNLY